MICFDQANARFQLRSAAIIVNEGAILLHRLEGDEYWALPGGRVELNETTQDCIARELFEEIEAKVEVENLSFVVESFFQIGERNFHEIGFYYQCQLYPNQPQLLASRFWGQEENKRLEYRWFSFGELQSLDIRPNFLRSVNFGKLCETVHIGFTA